MTRGALVFAAAFACSAAAGWVVFPDRMYRSAAQPVQFSHAVHTGPKNGLTCDTCHAFRGNGSFGGVPRLDTCAGCHAEAVGTTLAEREFVEKYVKTGREPEWLVYARQPDNAWFPHSTHVKTAKLDCERCHPGHGKSESLRPLELNRISGYTRDVMGRPGKAVFQRTGGMRMDDCVACHRRHGLEHSCLDCHK